MSKMKEFLMTLVATTVSIVLTFGTTAIVDRSKKNAEKREMVMMVMYDMRETLRAVEACNRGLSEFFDIQIEIVANPELYARKYSELAALIPIFEYTTTTESIFKSNIETIKTIGNILFVESVSSFYDDRTNYQSRVIQAFEDESGTAITSYEGLYGFNSANYPFYGQAYLSRMEGCFEQCKTLMKVTDEQLEVFCREHQKLMEATKQNEAEQRTIRLDELRERNQKLIQARQEAGRK